MEDMEQVFEGCHSLQSALSLQHLRTFEYGEAVKCVVQLRGGGRVAPANRCRRGESVTAWAANFKPLKLRHKRSSHVRTAAPLTFQNEKGSSGSNAND